MYAAVVPVDGKRWRAVVNLGSRPTFQERERLLEVHLLEFDGDLYGRELAVDFIERLRDVKKFESVDELRQQIAQDVETARSAAP